MSGEIKPMSTQRTASALFDPSGRIVGRLAILGIAVSVAIGALTATAADTTPPDITCGDGKSAEAGEDWFFDIPTAKDQIDGDNVLIEVVSTVTNVFSADCPTLFSVTRTWRATDTSSNSSFCNQTVTIVDTQPPDLRCGPDKHVECGAFWAFDIPTAVDEHDLNNVLIEVVATVTNVAAPRCPQIFSVTRTWRATDTCGNASFCNQTVTVVDTEPPELMCHEDKFAPPTATWMLDNPSAVDNCDLNNVLIEVVATVTNVLSGGPALFSVTRTWRVTDTCGNSSFCNQTVTVVITPVIDCPGNIITHSTGGLTPVTYNVTAVDANGPVPVTCVPPSGTGFPIGANNVICTAANANGTSTCTFTVTVLPPNHCPVASSLTLNVASGSSTNFHLPASDADGDPLSYIVTQPPAHGTVVVHIQSGAAVYTPNPGYCGPDSFKFKVNDGICDSSRATVTINMTCGELRTLKRQILAEVIAYRATVTDDDDQEELDDVIDHLQDSLADSLWVDENHLNPKKGKKVFDEEEDAVDHLDELLEDAEDGDTDIPESILHDWIDRLVAIDRQLAVISVDEAEARGANPHKIEEDREEIEDGDEDANEGKPDKAIKHYRDAWRHAVKLNVSKMKLATSSLGMQLHFQGLAGEQYALEVSEDLIKWTPLVSITAGSTGAIEYLDTDAVNYPRRFYRVVEANPDP